MGRILGKALYEGILVDVAFAGFFLAKVGQTVVSRGLKCSLIQPPQWLGKQSYLDDLPSLDNELYQGLIFLKHYSGDPADLALNFTVTQDEFGVAKSIELIPNGSNVPVTKENRLKYIHLVSVYKLSRQIRMQSYAFFDGLSEMINARWLRYVLPFIRTSLSICFLILQNCILVTDQSYGLRSMFNQQELQILLGGVDSPIDVNDLRANTQYGGLYADDQPTIQAFWRVMESFTHDQKRALLRFATSCSRPPLL